MHKALFLIVFILFLGCNKNSETKKYYDIDRNVLVVREMVKEFPIGNVLIGGISRAYILDDVLLLSDPQSFDQILHIFDKNDFSYLTSAIKKGRGPGEITNIGHVGVDEINRKFFISDHGPRKIFSYSLDSLMADPLCMPIEKGALAKQTFPAQYQYISYEMSIGIIIERIGNSDFNQSLGKWNMLTGDIEEFPYRHPDIKKKRIGFAVSPEHGLYVEVYNHHDLITIATIDGELRCNIYGRAWDTKVSNKYLYFEYAVICKDNIIVDYSGKERYSQRSKNFPTKLVIFDLEGNYIKTLETGYRITHFCCDEDNNRLIMVLDEEMQFAYLDLDGLLDA